MAGTHAIFYKPKYEPNMNLEKNSYLDHLLEERSNCIMSKKISLSNDIPLVLNDNDKTSLGSIFQPNIEKILQHSTPIIDKITDKENGREILANKFENKIEESLLKDREWKILLGNIEKYLKLKDVDLSLNKLLIYTNEGYSRNDLKITNIGDEIVEEIKEEEEKEEEEEEEKKVTTKRKGRKGSNVKAKKVKLDEKNVIKRKHLGYLLMDIPTALKGGDITYYKNQLDKEDSIILKWLTNEQSNNEFEAISFYTNFQYFIDKIESGCRLLLQFNLLSNGIEKKIVEDKPKNRYKETDKNLFEIVKHQNITSDLLLTYNNIEYIIEYIKNTNRILAIPLTFNYRHRNINPNYLLGCDYDLFHELINNGYLYKTNIFFLDTVAKFVGTLEDRSIGYNTVCVIDKPKNNEILNNINWSNVDYCYNKNIYFYNFYKDYGNFNDGWHLDYEEFNDDTPPIFKYFGRIFLILPKE